jgi:hypothetical protein
MEKDKHRKRKPISNGVAPHLDRTPVPFAGKPASAELVVSECRKQCKREQATDTYEENAGPNVPDLMISYDGQYKIN